SCKLWFNSSMNQASESWQESTGGVRRSRRRSKKWYWRWRAVACISSSLTFIQGALLVIEESRASITGRRSIIGGLDDMGMAFGIVIVASSCPMFIIFFSRFEVVTIEIKDFDSRRIFVEGSLLHMDFFTQRLLSYAWLQQQLL